MNCVLIYMDSHYCIYHPIKPLYLIASFNNRFYLLKALSFTRFNFGKCIEYQYYCEFIVYNNKIEEGLYLSNKNLDKNHVKYLSEDLEKCKSKLEYLNLLD